MKFLKGLLTLVLLAGVLGVGIVIAAPKYPQAQMVMDKLHLAVLQPVANETLASAAQIQSKLPELGQVLGIKTEASPVPGANKEASLPQKTLEYAKYAYCQQVVKDYEARNGIVSSGSATPKPSPKPSESARPVGSPLLKPTTPYRK